MKSKHYWLELWRRRRILGWENSVCDSRWNKATNPAFDKLMATFNNIMWQQLGILSRDQSLGIHIHQLPGVWGWYFILQRCFIWLTKSYHLGAICGKSIPNKLICKLIVGRICLLYKYVLISVIYIYSYLIILVRVAFICNFNIFWVDISTL